MGKVLLFQRRSDHYEDVLELLRELAEEERAERECGWLVEAVRRAKELPRMAGKLRPCPQTVRPRGDPTVAGSGEGC